MPLKKSGKDKRIKKIKKTESTKRTKITKSTKKTSKSNSSVLTNGQVQDLANVISSINSQLKQMEMPVRLKLQIVNSENNFDIIIELYESIDSDEISSISHNSSYDEVFNSLTKLDNYIKEVLTSLKSGDLDKILRHLYHDFK